MSAGDGTKGAVGAALADLAESSLYDEGERELAAHRLAMAVPWHRLPAPALWAALEVAIEALPAPDAEELAAAALAIVADNIEARGWLALGPGAPMPWEMH